MIPKIIHYVWINNNPYPEKVKWCLNTWKEFLPDYELVKWDYSKIKDIDNPFHLEAIKVGKYAFAADYIRLYALYNYGGIYLDTDVQVLKNFDDLLGNQCFLGREKWLHLHNDKQELYPTSHCIGAIRNHPYIKQCLDYYQGRHFITSTNVSLPEHLKFDMTLIPYMLNEILKLESYDSRPSKNKTIITLKNGVTVYPSQYFDCNEPTKDSYCKHWCMSSWRSDQEMAEREANKKINNIWSLRKDILIRRILNKLGYLAIPKQ